MVYLSLTMESWLLVKKFFEKNWPRQELRALITKQVTLNKKIILPI
jgi:hypothetical protein